MCEEQKKKQFNMFNSYHENTVATHFVGYWSDLFIKFMFELNFML